MKYALLAMVGLLSFSGALAGALALTGNLNQEALQRMMGVAPAVTAESGDLTSGDMDILVRQLREKEAALERREQDLREREAQVQQREASLQTLRGEVEAMQNRIQGSFADEETERATRVESVAITLTEMRPNKAAERLVGMPPEEIADILNLVEVKERGKIIEAMDPEIATRVLRELQERR